MFTYEARYGVKQNPSCINGLIKDIEKMFKLQKYVEFRKKHMNRIP